MSWIWFQLLAILLILGFFNFLETNKALRGTGGKPFPNWLDVSLKFFFISIALGPLVYWIDSNLFSFPILTPLFLIYIYTFVDLSEQSCGKKNPFVRKWRMWEYLKNYFSATLVKTCDLDPKKRYIFGIHPHGILPFGSQVILGHQCPGGFQDLFPGIDFRVLAASFCFFIPGYRDLLLWSGFVDAARYSAHRVLNSGLSIALVPGGATEALYADPHKDVVYLSPRKGFIRLALQHGASLVPCFTFNENNTYQQLQTSNRFITWAKFKFQRVFGISLPLITNIIPKRTKVTCVVGEPIDVPKFDDPPKEEVEKYLEIYKEKLVELYNKNKEKYNDPPDKEIEII